MPSINLLGANWVESAIQFHFVFWNPRETILELRVVIQKDAFLHLHTKA